MARSTCTSASDCPQAASSARHSTGLSITHATLPRHCSNCWICRSTACLRRANGPTAAAGISLLRGLVEQSQGRIRVMPGSGVRPENVGQIVRNRRGRDAPAPPARGQSIAVPPPEVPMSHATMPGETASHHVRIPRTGHPAGGPQARDLALQRSRPCVSRCPATRRQDLHHGAPSR